MKEEQNDISKMAADMEMIRKLQEKEDAKKRQGANGCAIFLVIILLFIGWLFLSPSKLQNNQKKCFLVSFITMTTNLYQ